jgi:hypothetical protein
MKEIKINLSPEQKLIQAQRLIHAAKLLKESSLKKFYPELTEEQIKTKVRKVFLYART